MTLIEDKSTTKILLKLRGQSQEDKLKLQGMLPLALNYFVTLMLNNREELARMIAVEYLPFNFVEKVDFVNYCQ